MHSKNDLVKTLKDHTNEIEDFLNGLAERGALPQDQLDKLQWELIGLICKDIPPEQCATGKIIERILEVESLMYDIKSELAKNTR